MCKLSISERKFGFEARSTSLADVRETGWMLIFFSVKRLRHASVCAFPP